MDALPAASQRDFFFTMNREYHKAYSQELHRDMEALVFGHAGMPLLVFPTSMGKFFEYEDRGMIRVLSPKIERGELQVFCPDGVDTESWYNKGVAPRQRVQRHIEYERYLINSLRHAYGFTGSPIRLLFRKGGGKTRAGRPAGKSRR